MNEQICQNINCKKPEYGDGNLGDFFYKIPIKGTPMVCRNCYFECLGVLNGKSKWIKKNLVTLKVALKNYHDKDRLKKLKRIL